VCRSRLRNGVGVEFEFQHNIGEADRDLAVPHDRETDRKFVDSPLEEDGFEPSVPDEGKPTHASVAFDRYRRHSGRSDTCARRPVAIAIRADTVVGGTRYSTNLHCPRLSD